MVNQNKTERLYKNGMSAFINQDYNTAIERFSQALDNNPDAYRVWVSRGASHLKTGQTQRALSDLNKAVALRPAYARAYHMRALAYDKDGDMDAAIRDLDKAIDLDPDYGAAYQSRAAMWGKMGKEDRALADMKRVTQLTEVQLTQFADAHNVLRSRHLTLEADEIVSELDR